MKNNIPFGMVQGRLTQSPPGCLQWFPQDGWEEEFQIASNIGMNYIELIAEINHNSKNPIWSDIGVALTGAILCSSEFGPGMAAQGDGVILNIASDLAVISPDQRLYKKEGLPNSEQPVKPVSYSVIKSGLIGLTRYLSTYWADSNVRCNALSPGGVYTCQNDEFVERLSYLIPLGRMAKREEYRGVIQFMCSDAAMYLNGQNIIMDGGRSVL